MVQVNLRPITPDDEAFLCRVYASTRQEEMSLVDWDEGQKEAFLTGQFLAQHRYYQEHYPGAAFQIIEVNGVPAGRLYVARWPQEIRIVDIALLPEWRNAGIGTALLKEIFQESADTGKPVSIHVELFNPAIKLYTRLGFRPAGQHGVYYLMVRSPDSE